MRQTRSGGQDSRKIISNLVTFQYFYHAFSLSLIQYINKNNIPMIATLNYTYNLISLIAWLSLYFYLLYSSLLQPFPLHLSHSTHLSNHIQFTKIIQSFAIIDILFILIKISKGSLLSSLLQFSGRMIVTWLYLCTQIRPLIVLNVLIAWSLADSNRFLYYVFKSKLTLMLRYNAFILLYPIGIYGQMTLMNDYYYKNEQSMSEQGKIFLKVVQGGILVGFVYLYFYMWSSRKRHLKAQQQKQHIKIQ